MHKIILALFAFISLPVIADESLPTGRLPRNVVPTNVAIELKIDPQQTRFNGHVRMQVRIAEAAQTIWMHGRDLTITQAQIQAKNGKKLKLTSSQVDVSGVLKFTAKEMIAAGEATIDIDYNAPYGELQGAYKVKPDGNDYVVTQMEPLGARNTFPSFDEPSFKQPWDITLIVPKQQNAVANTRQISESVSKEGWKTLKFATTENLPSYLIAFAVGPWDIVDGPDLPANSVRNYPVKLRGVAAKGQGAKMEYALKHTAEIVAAQEAYFDIAYPFDKLDLVAAPDFWAGAMENAGMIVYRDNLMFANEKSATYERQDYWGTHSHELAHQWFGNLVTMPWWDDLWLNEAFATWFGNKIVHQLQPEFHSDRSLMRSGLYAMDADSLVSTRRIHEPVKDFTDIQSAFDGITYSKGGAVLAMFERYVGEEKFRTAVRRYMKKHARGNAMSADLISEIAAVSENPEAVHAAFNSFIDQPGVPMVSVELKCAAEKVELLFSQERFLPAGSKATKDAKWGIPFCVNYGDAKGKKEQCQMMDQAKGSITLATNTCPAWVMPNANGAGYYRYALSAKDQSALGVHFDQLNEREQRIFADSLGAAFSVGAIDSNAYLQAASKLAQAPERRTVTAAMANIGFMVNQLAEDEKQKQAIRDYIAKIYRPRMEALSMNAKPGESDDDRILRSNLINFLADTGKNKLVRAELSKLGRAVLGIDGDGKLNADAAPIDIRSAALLMAAEEGDITVFESLLKHLRANQDPVLRNDLLGALSSTVDPNLAKRVRDLMFDQDVLRRNELPTALYSQGYQKENLPALREWMDNNFKALEAKVAPAGADLVAIYAENMCSMDEAVMLDSKFTERMRTIEGGPRTLLQTIESVQLCSSLRELQLKQGVSIPK
jgi:cytosol alanyl aminopeptidase